MSKRVYQAPGAASYDETVVEGRCVVMWTHDEGESGVFKDVVQVCNSLDAAKNAADRWQKKENAASKLGDEVEIPKELT